MGMPQQSSQPIPSLGQRRAVAAAHGVAPTDDDLTAVAGFLATILPGLAELERELPADVAPAGLFLPEEGR